MTAAVSQTFTLFLHREEPASVLVSLDGEQKGAVWLPKSQIVIAPERVETPADRNRRQTLTRIMVSVPCWLARQKGLQAQAAAGQGRLL